MTHSTGSGQAGPIRVVSPGATPEEVAAVTAVVTQALEELADDMAANSVTGVSAWQRSQRSMRASLTPGAGAWRGFSV